jgi:hypothetical protein
LHSIRRNTCILQDGYPCRLTRALVLSPPWWIKVHLIGWMYRRINAHMQYHTDVQGMFHTLKYLVKAKVVDRVVMMDVTDDSCAIKPASDSARKVCMVMCCAVLCCAVLSTLVYLS